MKLKLMIPTASILLLAFAVWLSPQVDPAPAPARADPSASRDILPAPSAQADTAEQKWLMEHCWEYGFILRYPEDKQDATGIIYEPWHYQRSRPCHEGERPVPGGISRDLKRLFFPGYPLVNFCVFSII